MTSLEFCAYLAGVTDSDGSFSICKKNFFGKSKNPEYSARFQLSWSNNDKTKKVLDKIVQIYGGKYSLCTPSSIKNYPNTKDVLHYSLGGPGIVKFVKDIFPFLLLKRRQALNIIRLRKFISNKWHKSNPQPQKLLEFKEKLYIFNKSLNTKNGWSKCA